MLSKATKTRGQSQSSKMRRTMAAGFGSRLMRSTNCFVGQPLALAALHRKASAGAVVHAELGASAVPEIELAQVAMQVKLADVPVGALNPPLEDREEPLTVLLRTLPRAYSSFE